MAPPARKRYQQIDLEGYARPPAARDRSLTEAAGLGEPPHLLRKLVAKSAELCEFVFEFEEHKARMPTFVSELTPSLTMRSEPTISAAIDRISASRACREVTIPTETKTRGIAPTNLAICQPFPRKSY